MNWISNVVTAEDPARSCGAKRRKICGSNARTAAQLVFHKDLEANLFVVPSSGYHMTIAGRRAARQPV